MTCDGCPPKFNAEFPPCFQKYVGFRSHRNPGNISELHYLAHRIKPILLDGIELDYVHRLLSNKSIIANWVLSHNKPSGFRCGGVYTAQIHDNIMQTPTIRADINPTTLSTNIGLLYYPFRCLRLETDMQRAAEDAPLQTQTCIEFCSSGSTLTTNLYDIRRDSGRATLSFLRSINDNLALGAELLLEWTDPRSMMTDTAFAGRYRRHSYSIAASVSRQGIDVSYWQRIHPHVQLASLWAWQRKTDKSVGTLCYQWDFKEAHVRGMFDSNLSVGFMYSRYLSHIPLSMAFSLFISLHTNKFIFGLKLNLDPCGLQRGE
ncbi:hypothetical protein FF38_04832 [Lucilia cuprina]|uniref:Mitochondrial import receptor subunit TOM40 n=1 Tax=Lucilia cuprina TaxID=7375 RepID=A0A0L0CIH7_LUCCU|nr:Mitochondrial import receptor subunit TOM40 like protein 1 [Lucilia cuprina]KNC32050.1 hypothetical protein FF38_04832 [Lucilia cuprina]